MTSFKCQEETNLDTGFDTIYDIDSLKLNAGGYY